MMNDADHRAKSTPEGAPFEEHPPDIRRIEPGVDADAARTTKVAGQDALAAAGLIPGTTDVGGTPVASSTTRRRLWLTVGIGIAVIATVMFAGLLPQAPALAWIGIALQLGLVILLVVSAFALPAGRYRRSRFAWITGAQSISAVVILLIIIAVAAAG